MDARGQYLLASSAGLGPGSAARPPGSTGSASSLPSHPTAPATSSDDFRGVHTVAAARGELEPPPESAGHARRVPLARPRAWASERIDAIDATDRATRTDDASWSSAFAIRPTHASKRDLR